MRFKHRVHCLLERGEGVLALRLVRLPCRQHLVPEQRSEQERRRHRPIGAHALVGLRQRERDEALAERLIEDHVEQRQHALVQAFGAQLAQAGAGMARKQQFEHFVEHPRRGHAVNERRQTADRRAGLGFDGEAELGGEAHRAQHPHRVLVKARFGIADHAHQAFFQIREPAVEIDDFLGSRVVIQRIDREIAPSRVLFDRAEHVVAKHAAMLVLFRRSGVRGTEGRHFDGFLAEHHVHQAKAPSDDERTAEQRLHLLGPRVGRDVVVLGRDPEQQVAHGAADHIGGEPGPAQRVANLECVCGQLLARDAVRAGRHALRGARIQTEYAADEFLDHCEARKFT